MSRQVIPRLGVGWKVVNFLVPGASRWWGQNERASVSDDLGAGLLISVRHPPTYDRLRGCALEWSIVEVAVGGRPAGTYTRSKSGPCWVGAEPGPATVTVRQVGPGTELLCETVDVVADGPTRLSITPALNSGLALRRTRPASITTRV